MYLQTRLSIQGGDTANLFAALHFPPLPRRKTNTYIKEKYENTQKISEHFLHFHTDGKTQNTNPHNIKHPNHISPK